MNPKASRTEKRREILAHIAIQQRAVRVNRKVLAESERRLAEAEAMLNKFRGKL